MCSNRRRREPRRSLLEFPMNRERVDTSIVRDDVVASKAVTDDGGARRIPRRSAPKYSLDTPTVDVAPLMANIMFTSVGWYVARADELGVFRRLVDGPATCEA